MPEAFLQPFTLASGVPRGPDIGKKGGEAVNHERGLSVDHTTIYRSRPTVRPRTGEALPASSEDHDRLRAWWMRRTSRSKASGCSCIERLIRTATHWSFSGVETRDAQAAKQFFSKVLTATHTVTPRVITVDKNPASPKALTQLKEEGSVPLQSELRQVKYLNNIVEQDHRFIKRLVKPGLGFFSFVTAWRTLQGYEAMHMIRKGQRKGVDKGDVRGQVTFIARLFGVAA